MTHFATIHFGDELAAVRSTERVISFRSLNVLDIIQLDGELSLDMIVFIV